MKTDSLTTKYSLLLIFLIGLFGCEGRRDFPELRETGVSLDNFDIILLISGESQDIAATFEPNIDPNREYLWEVDDPSVADLIINEDQSVSLTATGSGTTILRVTATDNDTITASAPLRVLSGPPVDITAQSELSVNRENSGGAEAGEGSPKLVDGDLGTKYLTGYMTPFFVDFMFDEPIVAGYYAITSGNDAPDRDARDWLIQGSQDGESWDTLDTRTGFSFPERTLTREFFFENQTAYRFYRFNVTANNGGSLFQMAEFSLFSLPD